jgi:hypothetical protein
MAEISEIKLASKKRAKISTTDQAKEIPISLENKEKIRKKKNSRKRILLVKRMF